MIAKISKLGRHGQNVFALTMWIGVMILIILQHISIDEGEHILVGVAFGCLVLGLLLINIAYRRLFQRVRELDPNWQAND